MQEMNHRIKNNLLMVRSLIHLAEDEKGVDLSDLAHQVTSISLVHELLHDTKSAEAINARSYVGRILDSIFPPLGVHEVVVENKIADVGFSPKAAGVLGLIVNEAATNAAKHAFGDGKHNRFSVSLERTAPTKWRLEIENTGTPFPKDVSLENPNSLGLRLITMLASQLEGSVELERDPTTRLIVQFTE
jgi:two-component sensor histidine kinase